MIPNMMKIRAKHCPSEVAGTVSPYPTVVMEAAAHHTECGTLSKPDCEYNSDEYVEHVLTNIRVVSFFLTFFGTQRKTVIC